MDKVKARTLSGFMELLPAPQQQMEVMLETLRRIYSLYGFTPLDTPAIEAAEVLLAKGGGETEKQMYRFMKGSSDLALRFDLTVPLAKYVAANYGQLAFPFRRYQIGKVWRGERAQRGRFREFYQADIDVIGDGKLDIMNDAEVPAVICPRVHRARPEDFTIRINNRKVLGGYFELVGITDKLTEALRTVDKLEKIGAEKVHELLMSECSLDSAAADKVLEFVTLSGSDEEKLAFLDERAGENERLAQGARGAAHGHRGPAQPGRAQGALRHRPHHSPRPRLLHRHGVRDGRQLAPGDRFRLLRRQVRQPRRILHGQAAARRGHEHRRDAPLLRAQRAGADKPRGQHRPLRRHRPAHDGGHRLRGAHAATVLRDYGVRTQLYTEDSASSSRSSPTPASSAIPYAVIIGEDELASGEVSLKDMNAGTQLRCTPEDAALGRARRPQGPCVRKTHKSQLNKKG